MVDARTSLEKYKSACRTLENFIIMPYGGVNRRPGTQYIAGAKFMDKTARLIGFNYSTTTRFVIEFGEYYGRVWGTSSNVHLAEFVSPYSAEQVADFKFVQANDVMFFVHPSFPPYKLSRLSDTSWTMAEIAWAWPALKDENVEGTTITPSAVTGNITLTASASLFTALDVGSYWQISHNRKVANANTGGVDSSYLLIALTATGTSGTIKIFGDWEFSTTGTWAAQLVIEKENASGAWEAIRTYEGKADKNFNTAGTMAEETNMRIRVTGFTSGTNGVARIDAVNGRVYGIVKITGFTSATVVSATVTRTLSAATATPYWAEGAWGAKNGYPQAIALHNSRLFLAGTSSQAMTVWGSTVDDFENLRVGVNENDAFVFTIFASEQNRINWMLPQDLLIVGTSGDEWTVGGSDPAKTLSSTNVKVSNQSRYGSANMQALLLADVVLFVQRNGRKVREMTYSFQRDGWVSVDLTLLAEHITVDGITSTAYQQQPDNILWAIRGDGTLIGMTYERDQSVVGWHRHLTDGEFESAATIHGNGTEDEVWFVVKRTVGGLSRRFIEKFSLNWRSRLDAGVAADWRYLDCYVENPPGSFKVDSVTAATVDGVSVLDISLEESLFDMELVDGDIITFAGVWGAPVTAKVKTHAGGLYWSLVDPVTNVLIDATGWSAYSSGGTATFANLYSVPLLAGKAVQLLKADGAVESVTATGGRVVATSQPLAVGLPYTSTLQPMRLNLELQDGTSQGRKARIHGIVARIYKSRGGEAMTNAGTWYALGEASGVFTGDRKITLAGGFDATADVTLRQTKPWPLTVLAIIPLWDVYGSE